MSQTIDQQNEQALMEELKATIVDAEFKVMTESNEESAMTGSGLQILFNNWSAQ